MGHATWERATHSSALSDAYYFVGGTMGHERMTPEQRLPVRGPKRGTNAAKFLPMAFNYLRLFDSVDPAMMRTDQKRTRR